MEKHRFLPIFTLLLTFCVSPLLTAQSIYDQPKQRKTTLADDDQDGVINVRDRCPNTPKSDTQINNYGCPIVDSGPNTAINLKIVFEPGMYQLKPEFYYSELKHLAKILQQRPSTRVIIEGHTDNVGDANYNQTLSQKRAQAVVQALIDGFDIEPRRVSAIGYGETDPLLPNTSPANREINRRVIARIYNSEPVKTQRWSIYSVD